MKLKGAEISAAGILVALLASLSACGSERVTVPNVKYKDPEAAYDLLHDAGFKVTIKGACSSSWLDGDFRFDFPLAGFHCAGTVVVTESHLGRSLRTGSTVVIGLGPVSDCGDFGPSFCVSGEDGMIRIQDPISRRAGSSQQPTLMPDLVGETLASAKRKVGCLGISVAHLPPLRAANSPHLLDNYVVTSQSPAEGEVVEPTASSPPCSRTVTFQVEC